MAGAALGHGAYRGCNQGINKVIENGVGTLALSRGYQGFFRANVFFCMSIIEVDFVHPSCPLDKQQSLVLHEICCYTALNSTLGKFPV